MTLEADVQCLKHALSFPRTACGARLKISIDDTQRTCLECDALYKLQQENESSYQRALLPGSFGSTSSRAVYDCR